MSDIVERLIKAHMSYQEAMAYVLELQDQYGRGVCTENHYHAARHEMRDKEAERDRLAAILRERISAGDACAAGFAARASYLQVHQMWSEADEAKLVRHLAAMEACEKEEK